MLYMFLLQHDPALPFDPEILDRHFAFADEALAWAEKMPDAVSGSTEVRPIVGVPGWNYAVAAARERLPMSA